MLNYLGRSAQFYRNSCTTWNGTFALTKRNNQIETKVVSSDNGKEVGVPVLKWGERVHENVDTFLVKQNLLLKYNPTEQQEVLALLQESKSPISTGEIAAKLNKSSPAVSKLLGKLKNRKLVVNPQHGQWTIKNNPSSDDPQIATSDSQIINT